MRRRLRQRWVSRPVRDVLGTECAVSQQRRQEPYTRRGPPSWAQDFTGRMEHFGLQFSRRLRPGTASKRIFSSVRYVDFTYDSVPRPERWTLVPVERNRRNVRAAGLKPGVNALYHNNGDSTFADARLANRQAFSIPRTCYGFRITDRWDSDRDGFAGYLSGSFERSTPSLLYLPLTARRDLHHTASGRRVRYNEDSVGAGEHGPFRRTISAMLAIPGHRQSQLQRKRCARAVPPSWGQQHFDVTYSAGLGKIKFCLGWGVRILRLVTTVDGRES